MRYLTIKFVRDAIQDRFPSDNEIEQDQFFSDEEILHAMHEAANAYNGLAPIGVDVVTPQHMPAVGTNVFLDCTIAMLYKQAIHKLTRNLITWQTGDTQVDVDKTRMQAFDAARKIAEEMWRAEAKDRKIDINRRQCYAYI